MQELRYFEHLGDRPVSWHCGADSTLRVIEGRLWLTVAGDPRDYWLRAGDTLPLTAGKPLWLSAHPQARFEVCIAPRAEAASPRTARGLVSSWLRGLQSRSSRGPVYG